MRVSAAAVACVLLVASSLSWSGDAVTPSEVMTCAGGAVLTTKTMTEDKYDAVAESVVALLKSLSPTCDTSNCEQADWAGCVLRMAGHDFMDFKDGKGGSDGCTDMSHADNKGLPECLSEGEHGVSLLQAYEQHCTTVSLADFLVIAAEAIMASSRAQADLDFKPTFRFGRTTSTSCEGAAHLLPNPLDSCGAVERTFVQNMGLSWRASAALMGVHSLGRAKIENSGFHGWWSDPENSRIFNNNYYVSLMAKGWQPETSVNGVAVKPQWGRIDQGLDNRLDDREHLTFDGHEMMLDTDMCLVYRENGEPVSSQKELSNEAAVDPQCCGWVTFSTGGTHCGTHQQCCGANNNDCGNPTRPDGPAAKDVIEFGNDEAKWLVEFKSAWAKATGNGFTNLKQLTPGTRKPTPVPTPAPAPVPAPRPSLFGGGGGLFGGRNGGLAR